MDFVRQQISGPVPMHPIFSDNHLEFEDEELKSWKAQKFIAIEPSPAAICKFLAILHEIKPVEYLDISDLIMSVALVLSRTVETDQLLFSEFTKFKKDFVEEDMRIYQLPHVECLLGQDAKLEVTTGKESEMSELMKTGYDRYKELIDRATWRNEEFERKLSEDPAYRKEAYRYLGTWCLSHLRWLALDKHNGNKMLQFFSEQNFLSIYSKYFGSHSLSPLVPLPILSEEYLDVLKKWNKSSYNMSAKFVLIRLVTIMAELEERPSDFGKTLSCINDLATGVLFDHLLVAYNWVKEAAEAAGVHIMAIIEDCPRQGWSDRSLDELKKFIVKYKLTADEYEGQKQEFKDKFERVDSKYHKIAPILNNWYFLRVGREHNTDIIGYCIAAIELLQPERAPIGYDFGTGRPYDLARECGREYAESILRKRS